MKYFVFCLLIVSSISIWGQNSNVELTVLDKIKQTPISHVQVWFNTLNFYTDDKGILKISIPKGKYIIAIYLTDYEPYSAETEINLDDQNLGIIELSPVLMNAQDMYATDELSTTNENESDDKQNVNGLLHASSDPYVNIVNYNLSIINFKIRGYDGSLFSVYLNGLLMNDPETGRASYSEWGGLNNVTRNHVTSQGLDAFEYSFGNIGGSTNIYINAGNIRKQNNLSYAFSNRSYNHRIMYTYSSGFSEKGITYAISFSKRYAEKGYVKGTWYDAYSYFASIEKKWNEKHNTAITILGSPYKRAMQAAATQECYDLIGSNYYNPNWGYQDGVIRNAKIRNVHQPVFLIYDKYQINDKLSIQNSLGYQFGRYGTTALNWYNANDPRPDYYRYLPSYFDDPFVQQITANYWTSSPDHYQINWAKLYETNYLANISGESARYILEEQRKDNNQFLYNSTTKYDLNEYTGLNFGVNGLIGSTHYFKVINDLLGANYWLDVDQYAERDFPSNPDILQNDLNNPNRKVKEGDIFGYNYKIHYSTHQLWSLWTQKLAKIDYFIQPHFSYTQYYRNGMMRNGRYPENSYGKSDVNNFIHYGIKTGLVYKITGRHFIIGRAAYLINPPYYENIYINPRISNRIIPDITQEKILSGEASYFLRGINQQFKITAYQTYFYDQTDIKSFYHDKYQTFVNVLLQNIDKIHQGIEISGDLKVNQNLTLFAAYNFGNYLYTNRPTAIISYDNGSKPDTTELIYQKGFYVPGFQNAGSFGVKYRNSKFWFASINVNIFDKGYLDFNPERRTEMAIANIGPGDPLIQQITEQEKLKGNYTIDFSIGKSWKINSYYIAVNANVNNVLNKQDIITGGYEQMRFDYNGVLTNANKFPPKYYYAYGRTFFIMISFRF